MPSFNDPNLTAQKRDLTAQADQLEQEIEQAPEGQDMSAQIDQLDQIEGQLAALQQQRKAAREQAKQQWQANKQANKQTNKKQ